MRFTSYLPTPLFGPGAYRFLLAFLVVIHHFSSLALGAAAVFVFFTLSGYWMAKVWHEKYSLMSSGYLRFVEARFWRLLPLFWAASAFTAALFIITGVRADRLIQAQWPEPSFFTQLLPHIVILGYNQLPFRPLVPAWSLDVEMQFYLCLPLLLLLFHKLGWRQSLLVVAGASALSAWWFGHEALITNLVFFGMGVAAYLTRWQPSAGLAHGSLLAVVFIIVSCIVSPPLRVTLFGGAQAGQMHATFNAVLSVTLACVSLPFSMRNVTQISTSTDKTLGDLSYSLYLFHSPFSIVMGTWWGHLPPSQRLVYVAGSIAGSILVAYAALLWIDRPAQEARNRKLRLLQNQGNHKGDFKNIPESKLTN